MAYTYTTTAIPSNYTYTAVATTDFLLVDKIEQLQEKIEQYCKKTDEHVDRLEEDIEFLNDTRHDMLDDIVIVRDLANQAISRIVSLEKEHKDLKNQVLWMENQQANMLTNIERIKNDVDEMKMHIEELCFAVKNK